MDNNQSEKQRNNRSGKRPFVLLLGQLAIVKKSILLSEIETFLYYFDRRSIRENSCRGAR